MTFNFTIANGDWVTVDFQGMPQPGEGLFLHRIHPARHPDTFANLGMWAGYETPGWGTGFFSTHNQLPALPAGTRLPGRCVRLGRSDGHSATGSYELTLTAQGNLAPVPEPETYAMMLAGLGLLGVMTRRRKQKAIA
jgi:hypothetical protein